MQSLRRFENVLGLKRPLGFIERIRVATWVSVVPNLPVGPAGLCGFDRFNSYPLGTIELPARALNLLTHKVL
jgi:hypothetical protein